METPTPTPVQNDFDDVTDVAGLHFVVHGKVQRVYMRKHTKQTADALSLKGWCKNTREGTVIGQAFGAVAKLDAFRQWLSTEGAPQAVVERADFEAIDVAKGAQWTDFVINRKKDDKHFEDC
jgi:acylphosphatase